MSARYLSWDGNIAESFPVSTDSDKQFKPFRYMIERGGWPHMNEPALEASCLKDANKFCEKRGLDLIQTSFTGRDGQVFAHNATCKLVFKAVPKGSAAAPANPP